MDNQIEKLHVLEELFRKEYGVHPTLWQDIVAHITLQKLRMDKPLYGDSGTVYFVLSGLFLKISEDERVLDFIDSGEFMMHTDVISESDRFVCKEPAVIAVLNLENITALLRLHPPFYGQILSKIYVNILDKRQLRSKLLDRPARERKELFYRLYPKIAQRRPNYEIASYLACNANYFGSI